MREKFSTVFFLLLSWLLFSRFAAAAPHLVNFGNEAMGTHVTMRVFAEDDAAAEQAMRDAFTEFQRIEKLMTTWREDSEVSRINQQAGIAPVKVSDETLEVIEAAQRASKLSDGAFDISFYALHGVWKFDDDLDPKLPDNKELKRRLALVNYQDIVVDHEKKTVFLRRSGMAISLGGIAKGYGVDRAIAVLRKAGFANAIVQAGGDLMCSGKKGDQSWTAGIRDPRGERDDVFAIMKLEGHAFSTAGDYERFFFIGKKRYHHIIDPKTGYPATRSRSVTIYAPSALLADALDDAVFILGWQRGLEIVESLDDVGAVVVDDKGQVHMSKRVADRVQIVHPPQRNSK